MSQHPSTSTRRPPRPPKSTKAKQAAALRPASFKPAHALSRPAQPHLPDQPLLATAHNDGQPLRRNPILTGDTAILLGIRTCIGPSLDNHVSMSRVSSRWRALYQGAEGGGSDFWEQLARQAGWEAVSSRPGSTAFLMVLAIVLHRRTCSLIVLRPRAQSVASSGCSELQVDGKDEGAWISLCSDAPEEGKSVWPPFSSSSPAIVPHPLLSDLFVPLAPPPPRHFVLTQTSLVDASDTSVPIAGHFPFLQQSATWPPREMVEIEFVWGDGARPGSVADEGFKHGRVVVKLGAAGSGRWLTVAGLVEGFCDYWRKELDMVEAKLLVRRFPEIDHRPVDSRGARGSWNKFLGQTRKQYGRWRFLGDATVLIGFFPSPASPSTRLTAYLASVDNIRAFTGGSFPNPPAPNGVAANELGLPVEIGMEDDAVGGMMVD